MFTAKALDSMGLDYLLVVEEGEFEDYAQRTEPQKILTIPKKYFDTYDTCDDVVDRSTGPGPARNFAWDHAIENFNCSRHWVMDDNLIHFYRLNRNEKIVVNTGAIFKAAEDFVDRYENVAISGFNYEKFAKSTDPVPPYVANTRVYSCLLIKNDINYRWRARYNEDTDLCLRVLKDGWSTVQFNAFLCGKVTTQRMKGGNTQEFYEHEGTKNKSEMLAQLHPDVAEVVWKFNRWHHSVDYKPFKNNKLKFKNSYQKKYGINEYGMRITKHGI